MTEHSTYDTLINRYLDARWLLEEARSKLAELLGAAAVCPDPDTLRELYREIDEYLGSEARETQRA
jgi:hypothetical protein